MANLILRRRVGLRKLIASLQSPWTWLVAAAGAILAADPLRAVLDRGSVLAIAGLLLGVVAITFGFVAILAQHLSEMYSRTLVRVLYERSAWRTTVVAEGIGTVVVVVVALWRPDQSAGACAVLILTVSLTESWGALTQLLGQFDPIGLIAHQRADAMEQMTAATGHVQVALTASQAILNLVSAAAAKGDWGN